MKIISNFVTNSSSSSFILGFNSADHIEETLHNEICKNKSGFEQYFIRIYNDCIAAETMNKKEIIEYVIETEIKGEVEIDLWDIWLDGETGYEYFEEYMKSDEYKKKEEKKIKEKREKLELDCGDNNVFIKVEYGNNDILCNIMEHYIVPKLNCCIRWFIHY